MSPTLTKARKWTCDQCGMSTSQIDGKPAPLPGTWASSTEGRFCLSCRRERAGEAALDSAPSDCPREARVKLRRTALIEFEIRRTPDLSNGIIAKACRSSVSAVAKTRDSLHLPDPPPLTKDARANHHEALSR
jgi:hypothetical protein